MTIQEVFNKQKEIMADLFPINKDADLTINTSVFCPVFTQNHKHVIELCQGGI